MSIEKLAPHLHAFSEFHTSSPIPHLGTRYNAAGRFLPEPGNTVVCHLPIGSETEAAIVAARDRYLGMPEARKLAFTPSSSLHMTLFQGIIEHRRSLPFWPDDVPLHTPIEDMTAIFLDRLVGFEPCGPFEVEVIKATPIGLTLDGVTGEDRLALKAWRNRLAGLLGYRHPDHETYTFHITFAYLMERFDDQAILRWQPFLEDIVLEIADHVPVLELNPPAFCSFEDMNHFEELLVFTPKTPTPSV
ncbi:DUF1868 domain-containing protein [Rhizobium sp. 18065]|uniref:DUF1868 domain-containing protein n=1 Tax=Rhizobium sp. 18065 TaxID=2681411 RepID=UPI00135A375D|nr:DUF1868 domain-containing protein [Rhizobium sp. 18065]